MPRTSSVSTGQSQSGVDRIPEKQAKSRPESARKMSPENQIKQEDLKSLVDIPRLPHAWGNRTLRNLKDFNSMPLMIKIEYLRTTAKFCHPIEKKETSMSQLLLMMTDGESALRCVKNIQRPETERI